MISYKQDTTLLAGREEQHLQQLLDNQENENLHNSYYILKWNYISIYGMAAKKG